ncbi:MAG TPA: hypothetical protein VJI75_02840 [Candidatus Nanoarchaeia archaeon]|nr:hypothetical protein [Candidatus Nanoarchaeia archaeon]
MASQQYQQTKMQAAQSAELPNMPERKFRAGVVSATIWKNVSSKEGKEVEYRTISLNRSYKDKNDAWQHTGSLRLNDLPRAVVVLQQAYEHLVLKGQHLGEAEQ